ncbi:MAG: prolyl oligopeptidase family serine peptidase [Gemmatimonadales bacterium]
MRWKSKDGMEIEGIVIYPVGYQPGRRYPTMAFIHGGPSGVWTQSFPGSWEDATTHVYAGNGWVSFYPTSGARPGWRKFLAANVRDWGGDWDVRSGLDYLVGRGIADSARMGQAGWSYGGYMTTWSAHPDQPLQGRDGRGPVSPTCTRVLDQRPQTVLENATSGRALGRRGSLSPGLGDDVPQARPRPRP